MSYKRNGIQLPSEIDDVGDGIRYGDPKLIHAALKAWLRKHDLRSIDPTTWNRPFVYRRRKKT